MENSYEKKKFDICKGMYGAGICRPAEHRML